MKHDIIEIKARCSDSARIRKILNSNKAIFKGKDHQVDTYFKVNSSRLKLREGDIENNLIYYERENNTGPKHSQVLLFNHEPGSLLKGILEKSLGVLAVVDKKREIYFIDNVKFHIDDVKGLGSFVEIEAISENGWIKKEKLMEQCNFFLKLFKIQKKDLINCSYSDLLLNKN